MKYLPVALFLVVAFSIGYLQRGTEVSTSQRALSTEKETPSTVSLKQNRASLPEPLYLPPNVNRDSTKEIEAEVADFSSPYSGGIVELRERELEVVENPYEALADLPPPDEMERKDSLLNYVATANALSSYAGRSSVNKTPNNTEASSPTRPNSSNIASSNSRPTTANSVSASATSTGDSSDTPSAAGETQNNPYLELIEQRENLTEEEKEEIQANRGSNLDAYLQAVKSLR